VIYIRRGSSDAGVDVDFTLMRRRAHGLDLNIKLTPLGRLPPLVPDGGASAWAVQHYSEPTAFESGPGQGRNIFLHADSAGAGVVAAVGAFQSGVPLDLVQGNPDGWHGAQWAT